jgi:hypothetical protein
MGRQSQADSPCVILKEKDVILKENSHATTVSEFQT